MEELTLEFSVNLRPVNHKSLHCFRNKLNQEPRIRQDLILAYQLKNFIEQNKTIAINQLAGWLGISYRRVFQLINLLLLAPQIQEEIILSEKPFIYRISERKMRVIIKEVIWEKQLLTWRGLCSPSL